MTHQNIIAGDVTSAVTHFALAGASIIARSLSDKPVTIHWSSESVPRAILTTQDVSLDDLAGALRDTAKRWSEGWASIEHHYGAGTFSPFSPRFKAIDAEKYPRDWAEHQKVRHDALDKLSAEHDDLALGFIHSLGEAAYWRFDRKSPRPDHGASRWEMKTRNRGEEFITHRFHPMCEELAQWSTQQIADGLTGEQVNDSLGKNSSDSRTSTGLSRPGPTDVALAFTGLLGISQFPLTPRTANVSVTPGVYPTTSLHPRLAVLPTPHRPITPERYRNIILSQAWARLTQEMGAETTGQSPETPNEDHRAWLRTRGITAASGFRIHLGGSSSAPERYLESGRLYQL